MEDEKLTIDQLAEKIKSKYPAYNDMDNTILVEKIIAKYPVYKDQLIEGSLKKKRRRYGIRCWSWFIGITRY